MVAFSLPRIMGPYERWVFTPSLGRPYAFPAIAQGPSHHFTGLLDGTDTPPQGGGITSRLPPLWNPSNAPRTVTPFAFHTKAPLVDEVATQAGPHYRVNFPISDKAWVRNYKPGCDMDKWTVPDTKPKAIVAVIDDGIPFAHRAFLDAQGGTRVSHCWLQSGRAEDTAAVPFGRELMNGDINALRAQCGDDEMLMYRTALAIDAGNSAVGTNMRRHASHGSHVMGMAAGNAAMFANCPLGDDVQIIAVQLPNKLSWDMSGFGKEMYMLSALHYIFDRAREIAVKYSLDPDFPEELPLIVNFSFGWSASRHDGGSAVDLAMEELLAQRKALQPASEIILPTGNNFGNDLHGQITAKDMKSGEYSFKWKLLPDDRTSSYIEVWFPEGMKVDDYTVTLSPPSATLTGGTIDLSPDPAFSTGDPRRYSDMKVGQDIVGQLSADKNRGNRWRVMAALIPTVNTRDQIRRAPSGEWTVTIKRNAGAAMKKHEQINVWVQRDDDPVGLNTGGKQSYVIQSPPAQHRSDPLQHYDAHLDFERGYGALNGIATAPSITRVAGYVNSTQRPSGYSGSGGLTAKGTDDALPWGAQPTITAVADQSNLRLGTPSIGLTSGSNMRLIGTSGAAPSVARLMVKNAAAGRDVMHGMGHALPLARVEDATDPIVRAKHDARTGPLTAPALTP